MALSTTVLTSFFDPAFSVRGPVAHGEAYGRGGSHCISWYRIQLILRHVLRPLLHPPCGTIVASDSSDP